MPDQSIFMLPYQYIFNPCFSILGSDMAAAFPLLNYCVSFSLISLLSTSLFLLLYNKP